MWLAGKELSDMENHMKKDEFLLQDAWDPEIDYKSIKKIHIFKVFQKSSDMLGREIEKL